MKLRAIPRRILLDGTAIGQREIVEQDADGYAVKPVANGGFAVTVNRRTSGKVTILLGER